MEKQVAEVFKNVQFNVRGHFILNFYAAVSCFINHIRYLGEMEGESIEMIFDKYPFLNRYFEEINRYMGGDIAPGEALKWWEREITAWEKSGNEHLPLLALENQGNINLQNRIALMIVGLVEEDSRFGTLFSRFQEPLAYRRPCVELVGQIMMNEGKNTDPWNVCRPLLSAGVIEAANKDAPRSEWMLRVPQILWDAIRGELEPDPAPWCQYFKAADFPDIKDLIFQEKFLERLEQIPSLITGGNIDAIVMRGMMGSERLEVIGGVARSLGMGIIALNGNTDDAKGHLALLGPLCSMTRSIPVITYDPGPGEIVELPTLSGYKGPIGIIMGFEGGLSGKAVEKSISLNLPAPDYLLRMRHWKKAFQGHKVTDLHEISERFRIPGGYIRQAAIMAISQAALDHREETGIGDIREACRALNRQLLDTLATRLDVEGSWDDLVVSETVSAKMMELEQRCRHRERVLDHLGTGFGSGRNTGVRALFTGASGTGKTLAARIIASELGMDLYRVDLAAVINKYIGETEKNLNRVLSRAEELDVILLLDEADALLGNRTDVKSANDRYANLETNYLLQRLENYQGIVLMTTNAGEHIDSAFQRRMDIVVNFVSPQAQERWNIWQLHIPERNAVDPVYLEEISARCALTGGQIRNAAMHATLLAVDEGIGVVAQRHLEEAIKSEYRKAGAIFPMGEKNKVRMSGMEAFVDALLYES